MSGREGRRILAHCSGFAVQAADGRVVGVVETPLVPQGATMPNFLIVRMPGRARARRPLVATSLVERIDLARRVIVVRGSEREITALPEHLSGEFLDGHLPGTPATSNDCEVAGSGREEPPRRGLHRPSPRLSLGRGR